MEYVRYEDDEDDEDAATQYMIEQSLLESTKQKETQRGSTTPDSKSSEPESADSSAIFTAIRQGNEKLLKGLSVRQRDRFSQTDSRGWTPLHEAAAQRNQNILELTFKVSGSVDSRTLRGQTPLLLAAEGGLIENASFLLQHGAKPDIQDCDLDSPLLVAIRSGRADLVQLLLLQGSSVDKEGLHGRCPLHEASRLGNVELVTRLLEAGARPDPRSHYGLTPLALAAQNAHLEVMENLLRRGADVLSQAQDEASILYEASASGDPAVISLLLEYGADANVAKNMGHMPIHHAAHRGHLQVLNLLIPVTSKGEVDDSGINPLHSAAAGGHALCIKALLDAGFDPNDMLHPWAQRSYDDGRKSALFFTVLNNDVPSAKLLLEAGAMANQDPIKCLQFCEVITVSWLKHLSGQVVLVLLDYLDHVTLCSKLKAAVMEQQQWPDICRLQESARCLQHLCRLQVRSCLGRLRLRSPVFMSFLPVPERLKDYILYREYDLYGKQSSTPG